MTLMTLMISLRYLPHFAVSYSPAVPDITSLHTFNEIHWGWMGERSRGLVKVANVLARVYREAEMKSGRIM